MKTNSSLATPVLAASALAATTLIAPAAASENVAELIGKIRGKNEKERGEAWQQAGPLGAAAVQPLIEVMAEAEFETARAATRALWKVVRHAGRPGAETEAKAVETALIPQLKNQSIPVRRAVLWMLSEIGGDDSVKPVAALLADKEVRDDARSALQRLPGEKSMQALRTALKEAPEDFRHAIAESLRKRGDKLAEYPSQKLVPTKATKVTAKE